MLHVTNGDSTAETLRATGLGGEVLAWRDVLNEGPVPRERLPEARAAFLAEAGCGDREAILTELVRRDAVVVDALRRARSVVLWFEHDLYDQLQLLQILALAAETGFEAGRLELINVGSFEGRPSFRGLGELDADELASLWPLRVPVSADPLALGRRGWDAVRAPDPGALEALVAGDTAAMPFLAAALRRLLEQLPDAESGLSRSERQLLEALRSGPKAPMQLFLASQEREEAPFEGDAWFFARLDELAAGRQPLLRKASPELVELTDAGGDVLAGRADRVELLGIDRWLGGTHLTRDKLWRWDRRARRVVR